MYAFIKTVIDLVLALIATVFLSVILVPVAIILKFTGERDVFYCQERIGYKNKTFKIWKFATMLRDSPNMGTGSLTVREDPRVTKIGRYLRITKINEMPQLINIFNGTMSIVGPRPQMRVDFEVYSEDIKSIIYNVKPGITGIGSIVFRDEEKLMSNIDEPIHSYYAEVIAPYKGQLELWYQRNASTSTDLLIILSTALIIVFPKTNFHELFFKNLPAMSPNLRKNYLKG